MTDVSKHRTAITLTDKQSDKIASVLEPQILHTSYTFCQILEPAISRKWNYKLIRNIGDGVR
jgi:hypothetical protein